MLLTIDVGNTHTVLGAYEGEELKHMWRVNTDARATADEARIMLRNLFDAEGIAPAEIHGIVLATVVPALNRVWKKVGSDLCAREVLSVNAESVRGILDTAGYQGTLGADRIADAVAAKQAYGVPCIVLDLGTATNIEVIDRQGKYRGGVIAPGVDTSMNALVSRAALLPAIELVDPGSAIGGSTVQAIQIGVVYGEVDRIDGLVRRIWGQLGYETPVVATGGFGGLMGQLSGTVTAVNPELTLQGLRAIYDLRAL